MSYHGKASEKKDITEIVNTSCGASYALFRYGLTIDSGGNS
jgi:hypothetical protein